MSVLEQRMEHMSRELRTLLNDLVSKREGIPRPIIGLNHEMPFFLPVLQRTILKLRKLADDSRQEFRPATLRLIVHPYQDPENMRSVDIAHPYTELTKGDVVDRLDDGSDVILARLAVKDIPADWRSERTLDLLIQGRSPSVRYGEALGVADTINLRTPRAAIQGKESGI